MKKSIYLLAFVLLSAVHFSCSSDSDGGSSGGSSDAIVGNWKNTAILYGGITEPLENEPCDDLFIKFNSNGKGKYTQKNCEESSDIINFSWEKSSGNYYYLTDETGEEGEIKITFSNNNKTMQMYSLGSEEDAAIFEKQ
ncbi:hypothetical protein [Flavobacterium sp.]|uniref:hypothetical protein n=1 Tax=Flavobacterium sp. TaxID=239 RepID=UPI00262201CA|nr:hypothetical protein [Flavobacterium sp.]MDD3004027.1 hypothetical protein [Flavobacterium sp.]